MIVLWALLAAPQPLWARTSNTTTERASVGSDERQANRESGYSDLSANGRRVVFDSAATNLVAHDTNRRDDIFVRNLATGTTRRVSVGRHGEQANNDSYQPFISGNGRFVAFTSNATNLVRRDANGRGFEDVFVHDLRNRKTTLVGVNSKEAQADRGGQVTGISADGRFVVFWSDATNLVRRDANEYSGDIFVRDRVGGTTEIASLNSKEIQANTTSGTDANISADGRLVAFSSYATNLVPHDTNRSWDVFVRNRATGKTKRVSVSSDESQTTRGPEGYGHSGNGGISDDGRFVAFESHAPNLVDGDANGEDDVFVRDRIRGTTALVSITSDGVHGNDLSGWPTISPDGRVVFFRSLATNLAVPDVNGRDEDLFVRDLVSGTTTRVSVASDGRQANSSSFEGGVSAGGRFVSFISDADNLVLGDTNRAADIFVRGPLEYSKGTRPARH